MIISRVATTIPPPLSSEAWIRAWPLRGSIVQELEPGDRIGPMPLGVTGRQSRLSTAG